MKTKIPLTLLLGTVIALFTAQIALAGDDWKEEQTKIFQQIPVKKDDIIDKSNWQKVKDLLPFSVLNWVKKGDYILKIGEFQWDFRPDKKWLKASAENEGKYKIGPNNDILDAKTGEPPVYAYGNFFPNIDVQDPNVAVKIMYNHKSEEERATGFISHYNVEWVNRQGYEREFLATYWRYYWWHRPDEQPNPKKYNMSEVNYVNAPYDVTGAVNLMFRHADGSDDTVYFYVPAIRRVKRLSGANRSDPFLGSDFCNDDTAGWGGQNASMNWKYLGERIVLMPVDNFATKGPHVFKKMPDGSYETPGLNCARVGYQVPGFKGAPWAIVPEDVVWIPRDMWVVEANAKNPYYNYGRTLFFVDKNSYAISFKVIHDKAGDYWKTIVIQWTQNLWGDDRRQTLEAQTLYTSVDDQTDHACLAYRGGWHRNHLYWDNFGGSKYSAKDFSVQAIRELSK